MRVLAYRRSTVPGISDGIEYTDSETLLNESDFVSLHCPLTDETRGLVSSAFIAKMKRGAYLINTSRGAVVNENDLAEALKDGTLAGAALDVMCKEPPEQDNPLTRLENCIITPHCAWVTPEARKRLLSILERNISSFVSTGTGINRVL